jgi:hypothetical protein
MRPKRIALRRGASERKDLMHLILFHAYESLKKMYQAAAYRISRFFLRDGSGALGNARDREALISLAVESWRFGKTFQRLLEKLNIEERSRYENQLRWFRKKTEDALNSVGMKIVNIEGQPFEPGMAATPLNLEEFEIDDALIVEQMLEPAIMGKEGLVKMGTMTLRKVER